MLVNCTPLGGAGKRDESPLPRELVSGPLVYDLTYGPGPSALLRDAKAAGSLTIDGLPMLVAQAERQFEWWTGQRPGAGRDGGRDSPEDGCRRADALASADPRTLKPPRYE